MVAASASDRPRAQPPCRRRRQEDCVARGDARARARGRRHAGASCSFARGTATLRGVFATACNALQRGIMRSYRVPAPFRGLKVCSMRWPGLWFMCAQAAQSTHEARELRTDYADMRLKLEQARTRTRCSTACAASRDSGARRCGCQGASLWTACTSAGAGRRSASLAEVQLRSHLCDVCFGCEPMHACYE